MQKAAAFKILNIYTFTLNFLHMQLSKGQHNTYVWIHSSWAQSWMWKRYTVLSTPQKIQTSFKRLPLNLAEGSNSPGQRGHEDFWEGLIHWMAFAKCLKTSAMLRTIFGSPKLYCREKCYSPAHCLFVGKLGHKTPCWKDNEQNGKWNVA